MHAGNEDIHKSLYEVEFGQIPPLTMEIAGLECLKIYVIMLSPFILIQSFSNLLVTKICIIL